MGTVAEEADESEHWLDVLRESGVGSGPEFDWLLRESNPKLLKSIPKSPDPQIPDP